MSTAQEDYNHSAASRTTPNSRMDDDMASDNDMSTAIHYEELHPNTPLFFGSGPAFMDKFNADPYADKRQDNVYYPFSSRGEWSLASWLSRSGLSMRAIDDFLALPIASFSVFITASFAN